MKAIALSLIALALILALIFVAGAVFTFLYARWIEWRYPPTGAFLEVDGLRLHYRDSGMAEGPSRGTVVLLHGASSNLAESMLGIGSLLTARYRVVALDRPGLGWSERGNRPGMARPERQADILARALRQLGVRNAVVVGHSWSGSVVPLFALDHTDVAGAILILGGVTHPWPGGYVAWYNGIVTSRLGRLLTWTIAVPISLLFRASVAERVFAPQPVPPGFMQRAQIPLGFRPAAVLANSEDIGALYAAVSRQSIRYAEIRIPVTVVAGDEDRIVWTDLHSRSFAHDVPSAKLIVLPDVGHMPQYAEPDLVRMEIEALAERIAWPSKAAMP